MTGRPGRGRGRVSNSGNNARTTRSGGRGSNNSLPSNSQGNSQAQGNVGSNSVIVQSGNGAGSISNASSNVLSTVTDATCGTCVSAVGGDAIGCDSCNLWFHPTTMCTGLKTTTIYVIRNEGGEGIVFRCSSCRCGTGNNSPARGNSSETVAQLHEMVKSLVITVSNLSAQFSKFLSHSEQSRNVPVATSVEPRTRSELYSELWEFEERRKRRESIIVLGTEVGNVAEFRQVFGNITGHLTGNIANPNDITCINADRSIYRVKIADYSTRNNILLKAKELKDSELYKNVYINKDLTYNQREELRQRLAARRSRNDRYNNTSNPNDGSAQSQNLHASQPPNRVADVDPGPTSQNF